MLDFWFYARAARDLVFLIVCVYVLVGLINDSRRARQWRKGRA